ncbi:hypothetical protein Bca4012_053624 [Brassica carinata]
MAEEGCKFVGVLIAGLMIEKKSGLPKLIPVWRSRMSGEEKINRSSLGLRPFLFLNSEVLLAACRGELKNPLTPEKIKANLDRKRAARDKAEKKKAADKAKKDAKFNAAQKDYGHIKVALKML